MDIKTIVEQLGIRIESISSTGEIIALCPFHDDKHASLNINMETGAYQCWSGCVRGRSIHSLVLKMTGKPLQETEEATWQDAIKDKLNSMGGKKKSFNKMMSPSIPMLPSALGNKGEEFLLRRGFTQDTIKKWGLMYWLEQDAIVIPIEDVGFSRRFLSSKSKDKYKTIGGTRVSETLFGLKFFKFNGKIILLEGAFDVIWMHQLGFTNSLAILGGNLTEEQRKILIGYGGQMYFMFDKDRGGEQILEKAYGKLKRDFVIRFCYLPEGKDPNDCTMDEIRSAIKNSSVYRKEEM